MSIKIDYKSIPKSYRDYLDLMVREGEFLALADFQQGQGLSGIPLCRVGHDQERHARPAVGTHRTLRRRAARRHPHGDTGRLYPFHGKKQGTSANHR